MEGNNYAGGWVTITKVVHSPQAVIPFLDSKDLSITKLVVSEEKPMEVSDFDDIKKSHEDNRVREIAEREVKSLKAKLAILQETLNQ